MYIGGTYHAVSHKVDAGTFRQVLLQVLVHLICPFLYATRSLDADHHDFATEGIPKHI